jgi:hypothetical protein
MFESKYFTITLQTAPGEDVDLAGEEAQKLVQEASRFRGDVVNQVVYIEDKLNQLFRSIVPRQLGEERENCSRGRSIEKRGDFGP